MYLLMIKEGSAIRQKFPGGSMSSLIILDPGIHLGRISCSPSLLTPGLVNRSRCSRLSPLSLSALQQQGTCPEIVSSGGKLSCNLPQRRRQKPSRDAVASPLSSYIQHIAKHPASHLHGREANGVHVLFRHVDAAHLALKRIVRGIFHLRGEL